jgi:hypothetical protein
LVSALGSIGSEGIRLLCRPAIESGKNNVVFAGMLGGVLEPGGDTICAAVDLAFAALRVAGLPESLFVSAMVLREYKESLQMAVEHGVQRNRANKCDRSESRSATKRASTGESDASDGVSGQM